jgi:hypothetical protein
MFGAKRRFSLTLSAREQRCSRTHSNRASGWAMGISERMFGAMRRFPFMLSKELNAIFDSFERHAIELLAVVE